MDFDAHLLRALGVCTVRFHILYDQASTRKTAKGKKSKKQSEEEDYKARLLRAMRAMVYWQNEGLLDLDRIKSIWSQVCGEDLAGHDIAFPIQEPNHRQNILSGLKALLWFSKQLQKQKDPILLVQQPFQIPVGKHSIKGLIEIGFRSARGPELWVFETNYQYTDSWQAAHDSPATMARFAYQVLYNNKPNRMIWINPACQTKTLIYLRDAHLTTLVERVEQAGRLLKSGIRYPVYNESCESCEVKEICDRGDWIEDRVRRQKTWQDAHRRTQQRNYDRARKQ